MLDNFRELLKNGRSRNYYDILLYYFLANISRDDSFNDISIFGVMPSSSGKLSSDLFSFSEHVRIIKNVRYPKNILSLPEENNILIRHTSKPSQHSGDQTGREQLGGKQEFDTLIINPLYKKKIEKLRKQNKLNICIFDDYMDFGNGFNAVRCLFEHIGANKILFVSMGMFRRTFYRKVYNDSKLEIDNLYNIYNS